jgi:predicted KAP-like P-loop ATPase
MPETDLHELGDDLPKVNPWTEDRLGFAPFAERLARVIRTLRAGNGYVIGLHGEWGSGKSTALNFVNEYLKKHNEEATERDRIYVIDFRPWIIAGHQDLIAGFFKIVAENVGKKPGVFSRAVNKVVRIGKVTADPLLDALATVALVIDPTGGTASKAVTTVAKKSVGGMIDRFLAEPSLQKAYDDLRKALTDTGKRFLVTIDDLDRLDDDEVRSIMQMVKTVGRLPNVVYLLSYDREIVWRMLDGEQARAGPKYGEKIVQQEVELPRPSKDSLLTFFDEEVVFLTNEIEESVRWQYIVLDGVRRWIRHPRDVWRLANAIKFSWPALHGEIDPADLITMEGFRLFDPEAFKWIRWNRDFLFSEGSFLMASDGASEAIVERLKGSLPEATREQILRLLTVLFPGRTKAFAGKNAMSDEAPAATAARRGVGYAPGYDAYFALRPSSDAIPKSVIDGVIAKLGDADALRRVILPYLEKRDRRGQPAIGQLLEELRYRFYGHGRPAPTQQMLDVLFGLGEQVLGSDWTAEAFALSPRAQLSFLVADLLEGWGQEHAGAHLLEAFRNCDSPAFCADVFVDRARELGKIPDQSRGSPTITESDFKQLGAALLAKIERAAADGTLADAPFYFDIVRAWSLMGKAEDARAWLAAGIMDDAKFLAKAAIGLVSYSLGRGERSYTLRERPDETLYDLRMLRDAAVRHANSIELTQDDRNRIRSASEGLDRILQRDAARAETSRDEVASVTD